jgi:predicted nucleotidyltransferase
MKKINRRQLMFGWVTMALEEKIKEVLGRERHVKLTYLFGSAALGETGKLSDIDVAVYLDESLPSEERFRLQLKLMGELASVLQTNKVDLVVMNDAPLLLSYNIIKYGKLLKSDVQARVRVESSILSRYLDMKYFIDRHTRFGIERMARSGLT